MQTTHGALINIVKTLRISLRKGFEKLVNYYSYM